MSVSPVVQDAAETILIVGKLAKIAKGAGAINDLNKARKGIVISNGVLYGTITAAETSAAVINGSVTVYHLSKKEYVPAAISGLDALFSVIGARSATGQFLEAKDFARLQKRAAQALERQAVIDADGITKYLDELGTPPTSEQRRFLNNLAEDYSSGVGNAMSDSIRELKPRETVIGFIDRRGKLVGELTDARVGHDALADLTDGVRTKLEAGQLFAISINKDSLGKIHVFGSGTFEHPDGILPEYLRTFGKMLVEIEI